MLQGKGFGPHTCPQWSMCVKHSEVCVCVPCFRKQEGDGAIFFYMNSTVLIKPALPISQKGGALIQQKMSPGPHTAASPRTLLSSRAPSPHKSGSGIIGITGKLSPCLWVFICSFLSFLSSDSNGACRGLAAPLEG